MVIEELSSWLLSSKNLDAAFLKRHGPRGLVAAAKRFWGRFDAALNAANLAVSVKIGASHVVERRQLEQSRVSRSRR